MNSEAKEIMKEVSKNNRKSVERDEKSNINSSTTTALSAQNEKALMDFLRSHAKNGWVHYSSVRSKSSFPKIENFLSVVNPETLKPLAKQFNLHWIAITNEHHEQEKKQGAENLNVAEQEWTALQKRKKKNNEEITTADIIAIGKKSNCLVGKWLIFPHASKIQEEWSKIAIATSNGTLGCTASKCSVTPDHSQCHCICVYTYDFGDTADVKNVRKQLQKLGYTNTLSYKADIYTYLNIYKGNPYKLDPCIYHI